MIFSLTAEGVQVGVGAKIPGDDLRWQGRPMANDATDAGHPPDLDGDLARLEAWITSRLAGGHLTTPEGREVFEGYLAVIQAARGGDRDALDWLLGRGRTARYLVNGEFVYRFERFADAPDPDMTEVFPGERW